MANCWSDENNWLKTDSQIRNGDCIFFPTLGIIHFNYPVQTLFNLISRTLIASGDIVVNDATNSRTINTNLKARFKLEIVFAR